jgi:apolipoprotein D and lipocalin family protein
MKRSTKGLLLAAGVGAVAALLTACQSTGATRALPPLALAPSVDIPRFMGDWYVIAAIPTFLEKDAFGGKENYRREADGTIATTFSFRAGALDGPPRTYRSTGFVLGANGAVWGQQYIWPIKADYRISYVAADYSATVITREKRDYVWIMARTPTMDEAELQKLIAFAAAQGYEPAKIQRVPQPAAN